MVGLALHHAAERHEAVEPRDAAQRDADRLRQLERARDVQLLEGRAGLAQDPRRAVRQPVHHVRGNRARAPPGDAARGPPTRGAAGSAASAVLIGVPSSTMFAIGRWSTMFRP